MMIKASQSLSAAGLALAIAPALAHSQLRRDITVFEPATAINAAVCSPRFQDRGPAWARMLELREMERDPARALLSDLQDQVESDAAARPTDVELQYVLATVIGVRAEVEKGRSKVRAANAVYRQVAVVLALDPEHAGAQHLLGRLHAGVMRMDRITRFIATRLLGGGELSGASWEEARRLLESAVAGDPCIADHHYELARLYADRGEQSAARQQIEQMLRMGGSQTRDRVVVSRAMKLLEELASE